MPSNKLKAVFERHMKLVCLDKLKTNYCKSILDSKNPFDWYMFEYAIMAMETELAAQGHKIEFTV